MSPAIPDTDVTDALSALQVVPVATLDPQLAEGVGQRLVASGLPCLEIRFRDDRAPEAIARASRVPGLLVGAGTILEPAQASAAAAAGASFAVSPGLNEDVVECCRKLALPLFPGIATPTEIERARRLGLRTLKAFPISALGGVAFLRALSPIYPDVQFVPTGGINVKNLAEYLALPNVLACAGSWLIEHDDLTGPGLDRLTVRIRDTLALVR